jgi:hemerythrin-like metal-binding protein
MPLPAMPTLIWSDSHSLDHARMDSSHIEFVERLAGLEAALDAAPDQLPPAFDALLAHTVAHFEQEERWMAAIGFASENGHAVQHQHVLDVLHEVKVVIGITGDVQILRRLVSELAAWFTAHAQMMDSVLAQAMNACGFDGCS